MRAAILLFLSICFSLIRGIDYVDTHAHQNIISYSPSQNVEPTVKARFNHTSEEYTLAKNTGISNWKESSIIAENEEEDFDTNYLLRGQHFIVLSFTFDPKYSCSYINNSLPFYNNLSSSSSYKYITLRSLRI